MKEDKISVGTEVEVAAAEQPFSASGLSAPPTPPASPTPPIPLTSPALPTLQEDQATAVKAFLLEADLGLSSQSVSDASAPDKPVGVAAEEDSPTDDDSRAELFRSIEDAIVLGNSEVATAQLEQFKATYGGETEFLYLTGKMLRQQGEVKPAYEIFKKLYFEWPVFMAERRDYEELRDILLADLLERGRSQWNKVLALAARRASQESANALQGKAPLTLDDAMKADMEKLLTLYDHILKIEPYQPIAIKGLIQCYGELGRIEKSQEAQETFREAQSYWNGLSGKRAQSILTEARERVKEGHEEEIIPLLNLGLDSTPYHTGLLYFKAEILRRLGKFREAISCLDNLLRENPTDNEGIQLKRKIQSERVGELVAKGLVFLFETEERPAPSGNLKEKVKKALDCFYDALDLDINNVRALGGVYRCQMMTNNTLKAKRTLDRIRTIDPRFPLSQLTSALNEDKTKDEPGCFVATRLYGVHHPKTELLRAFREETLRHSLPGRLFICLYKRIGSRLAQLSERGLLIPLLRKVIDSVIRSLGPVVYGVTAPH
ncbi:MAG: hypothetical protein WA705_24485 [Candidatus Ozemobacteraceae bacterium]